MNIFRSRFLMVAGLAGAAGLLANVNCGSSGGGGTGGTTGTGGTSATGGKSGTGGSGTGGKATGGNGGAATGGNGGATATGGAGGKATGGSGGAATGGSGGSSTTDGGSGTAPFSFTFDKNTEGFNFNNFNSSGGNLFDVDGGTKPTLTWDNTVGSPGSTPTGSLKLDVTFTDFNQFVLISSGTKPLINSSSKSAQVMVMLEAVDGGHVFGGGVQLEANSGASFTGSASGTYTTLTPGTWTKVPLDLTSGTLDRTQIVQFSINVTTGSMPDGGTFAGPVHAVLHIDTLDDGSGNSGPVPPNATFDATTQGFTVSAATHPDGGATPTVTFDSATGNPNPGSIEVTLPFNAFNQQYSIQSDVAPAADLSGKTIHAKVMLDKVDGGPASVPSNYVQLFVQSSQFKFANGPGGNLTAGTWTDLTLTVSSPSFMVSGYDPTQIIQVGVQVGIGGMPDGGTFGAEISPHIHIDSIVAQ